MKKLIHRGLHYSRTTDTPCTQQRREKAFAELWERENEKAHFLALLTSKDRDGIRGREVVVPITQEHATVAATVVQWLGSHVGFCFMNEALRDAGYVVTEDKALLAKASRVSPPLGAKVYIPRDRYPYRVRARNDRYAVCTKPHNPKRTVLYFILDAEEGVRGPEDVTCDFGAKTDDDCAKMLHRLTIGQSGISRRHRVPWDVSRVVVPEPPAG